MPTYKEKKQRLREKVKMQQQQRIRKIQQQGYNFQASDPFRVAEKHYKYYVHRQTDYSKVLQPQHMKKLDIQGFQVYKLPQPEGAYLVKNFLSIQSQIKIGFQALNDYVRKPYRTNLDGTNGLYLQQKKQNQSQENKKNEQKQELITDKNNQEYISKTQKQSIQNEGKYFFDQRIRMANLGYQYDWPHRTYPKSHVPISNSVLLLTREARNLFQKIQNKPINQYHGEAVIVNFYKPRQYMIGHLDDGEEDQQNPIFSFSFGLSCIFLIGGPDKQKAPVAIRLESGDLLIMSGYSRICYHGVPRIIQDSYKCPSEGEYLQKIREKIDCLVEYPHRMNGSQQVMSYFEGHRLNVNIRQVWRRGQGQQKMEQIDKLIQKQNKPQ